MRQLALSLTLALLMCGCPSGGGGSQKNPLDVDLWSGRYVGEAVTVELERADDGYRGTVTQKAGEYPLTAQASSKDVLEGSFTVGEDSFPCTLKLTREGLDFTTGSSTYALKQEQPEPPASKNPLDGGGSKNPLDGGGAPPTKDPAPAPTPAPPSGTDPAPSNPLAGGSTGGNTPAPSNPLAGGNTPAPTNPLAGGADPSVSTAGEGGVEVNPWAADWREFKHPSGVSFRHPASWRLQEADGGVQAIPPDLGTDAQGNPVELYVVNADQADGLTGPDSPEAQAYVQREIGAQFPRLQSKGAPQRRELRGRTIAIYAWSGTAPTGETVESRLYAAIEGKLVYFLFALGTGDRVERRGPILEAIVSSFGYSAPPKDERLTGYWRYTRSTSDPASGFSMSTDHHLRLDADGRAFFATQTAGGDANTSVITEDRGWTKRGQWRTEGKRLVVDWQDGGQLAVDYVCDGQSLMFKRSSGNQLYERVR